MNKTKIMTALVAGTIAASALGGFAYARDHETNRAGVLANAKISLSQAITAAEAASGGKAVDAGIEDENGTGLFEVTVQENSAQKTYLVDTQTGKVVKTKAADDERNHDGGDGDKERRD